MSIEKFLNSIFEAARKSMVNSMCQQIKDEAFGQYRKLFGHIPVEDDLRQVAETICYAVVEAANERIKELRKGENQ